MISVATAARLLDFDRVMHNPQRAEDQLHGAVALHNILERHGVAYLADEVGMGKTYVALGVVALMRHFQPNLRVLVIAPRENIQRKWQREQTVFTKNNVRLDDLRVRMPGGLPARPLVECHNLLELLHETALDPDRDFFVRLPSFSLPLRGDADQRRKLRDRLRTGLPWLPDGLVDLRANPDVVKDRFAEAINTVLPYFDLVIVDEAHNLKHGWGLNVSSRNRVLATVLGRDRPDIEPALRRLYGPRAGKVLLLSATPIEDDYRQLWNQLDVFSRAEPFRVLRDREASDDDKRAAVAKFLIRRVTSLRVGEQRMTKNLYRREWRNGGVAIHDEPIRIIDDRQRLTVALVQKKVSELLGHERFGSRFQVGMLASFESFMQTTGKRLDPDDATAEEVNFDGAEQTDDAAERQGVDVPMLNDLARSYKGRFSTELPHPKMDALVDTLATSWREGRKGLVFVRRVASVEDLKQKLDDDYNKWLADRLKQRLDKRHREVLDEALTAFHAQRSSRRGRQSADTGDRGREDDNVGGIDTFFAWFFRGRGPEGIVSGATLQGRFRSGSGPLGTFFEDNHVLAILGAPTDQVRAALADALGIDVATLGARVRAGSRHYLTDAKQPTRGARFDAAQAAALELLTQTEGPHRAAAEVIWRELYRPKHGRAVDAEAEPEMLETTTFFTELRNREKLRNALWPEASGLETAHAFRDRYLRAQVLSAAARLGHAFVDLYTVLTDHLPALRLSAAIDLGGDVIAAYLDELERQMGSPAEVRGWSAFDELAALAEHHDLVLDTNLPEARQSPLLELPTLVGRLFSTQQPIGGMAGQVNRRLVQQFRLPGYPFVLICTDLLQEGEDLHTFCSRIYHYGLAWTPSGTEQRIGRIDRVRSQTERRLTALGAAPDGDDLLQVYYPHLVDTVERLQVRRVLRRMNDFTRLMHEGLGLPPDGDGHLDVGRAVLVDAEIPGPPTVPLETSFPVRDEHLAGKDRALAVDERLAGRLLRRFDALANGDLAGVEVSWELSEPQQGILLATALLEGGRKQPFSLQLGWEAEHVVVRCVSPVGLVDRRWRWDELADSTEAVPVRIGVVQVGRDGSYDVTGEEDVALTHPRHDPARIGALVHRVTTQADALEREHRPDRHRLLETFRRELERDAGARDDLQRLCETDDLTVKRGRVRVKFTGGRSHEVRIHDVDGGYLVTATVAGRDAVRQLEDPYRHAWERNRRSRLVGFRVGPDGVLVAHGWMPKAGLTPEAFQLVVRTVAREADRYEFQLTGTDQR